MITEILLGVLFFQDPAAPPASARSGHHGGEALVAGEAGASTASTSTATSSLPVWSDKAYRIGPEDVLQIEVFKEADFTESVLVRTDGKISVPLLNDVQAAGLTPLELAAALREHLSEFVKEPKVTVVVTQMNSRKAFVMGQVNRQGVVRLISSLTVLQAISAAGGLAPFAKSKQIYILRNDGLEQKKLPFNYDAVIKGKHREQNVVLEPGDTVVVP